MKLSHMLVLIVVLVVLGLLVWRFFPGLRQKGRELYRNRGGWTEAARRDDPVGFIDYAQARLAKDVQTMRDTRQQLAAAQESVAATTVRHEELWRAAETLATRFRDAYRQARDGGGFPVAVSGRQYSETELLEQVRLILLQQGTYKTILADCARAGATAAEKQNQLLGQISLTEAALAALPAKREIARVDALTGQTKELLEQVNALLGQNEEVLSQSPIRPVEELLRADTGAAAGAGIGAADVQRFLEGAE